MAGIDIRMFKSHSTYAASTTIADLTGVSVCDTVKQEQWSNKSTFYRFYKKGAIDWS